MDVWCIQYQMLQEENELKECTSESQQVALNRLNTKIKLVSKIKFSFI